MQNLTLNPVTWTRARRFVPLLVVLFVPNAVVAQDPVEVEVREAAAAFVDAMNDLDWGRFTERWAEDATAFLPVPGLDQRVQGRDAIVEAFRTVFSGLEDREEGPPYLSIQPLDLRIQAGAEAAVVSFHLGDEPPFARRTLVFARDGARWLVHHLHASGAPPPRG
jgi:ketosteroid isomerase-like protein